MKISEAIKEIIKLRDLAIFGEYKKFIAMLADFSTGTHKKELDVFRNAVDENMLKMCVDDSLEERRKILKLQIQLENKGLSQDWINFIIESFALPLGWNYTPKPITQPQTQQVQKQNISSSPKEWTCSCGCVNTTNFCGNCGSAKPTPKVSNDWTCVCGTVNTTNFCGNCGLAKPTPKVSNDWTCVCGTVNTTKCVCTTCGRSKGQQQTRQQVQQKQHSVQKPLSQQQVKQQITKQTQQQQGITTKKAPQQVQQQGNYFKNAKVGDYVKFGNYPQTSNGGVQPIEWQVLAIENNKMLVISRYGLDAKRFDSSSNNWANSEIRKWLNGDFYNKAFSENDKKYINLSNLSDVGTSDNVFLLSGDWDGNGEANEYFADDEARKCKATKYAKKNGAWVNSSNGYSYWWLRSPDPDSSDSAFYVSDDGIISYNYVDCAYVVVRPALYINL